MTLLENDAFLVELSKLFQKSRTTGKVNVSMKRYDGSTKPKPRDGSFVAPSEYKCLFRATFGARKISTVVVAKDVNKFQLAYSSLLKLSMDSLKKRERKDKDKGRTAQ